MKKYTPLLMTAVITCLGIGSSLATVTMTDLLNYSTIQPGFVPAFNPGSNAPAEILVIPEPGTTLLGGLAALAFLRRRRTD